MIHVEPADEPDDFDAQVRKPGLSALEELVGNPPTVKRRGRKRAQLKIKGRPITSKSEIPPDKFPPFWTRALDALMSSYHRVCAFSCFAIHPVTGSGSVDHMAPKSRRWEQVYEWSNYRLVCLRLNSRKGDFGDILDPFEIEDGWFVLELVGFQVKPADGVGAELRQRIEATIRRLELNDRAFRSRRELDAQRYWDKEVALSVLCEESPFVAHELRRQRRLHASDVLDPINPASGSPTAVDEAQ